MPNYYGIYLGDANNIFTPEIYNINSNYTENLSKSVETTFPIEINHSLFALNTEVETPNKKISSKITDKTSEIQLKNAYRKCQKLGI